MAAHNTRLTKQSQEKEITTFQKTICISEPRPRRPMTNVYCGYLLLISNAKNLVYLRLNGCANHHNKAAFALLGRYTTTPYGYLSLEKPAVAQRCLPLHAAHCKRATRHCDHMHTSDTSSSDPALSAVAALTWKNLLRFASTLTRIYPICQKLKIANCVLVSSA